MTRLDELLYKVRNEETPSFELQKAFIDEYLKVTENEETISIIPEEKLLPETFAYMIRIKPEYLIRIPKEARSYNLCLLAVKSCNGSPSQIMKLIPKEYFNTELSKECVIKDPKVIRKIPAPIITEEFINDLTLNNVDLSSEQAHINICLDLNRIFKKMESLDNKELTDLDFKNLLKSTRPVNDDGVNLLPGEQSLNEEDDDLLSKQINALTSDLNWLIEEKDRIERDINATMAKIEELKQEQKQDSFSK